jgi:hypothetical protein
MACIATEPRDKATNWYFNYLYVELIPSEGVCKGIASKSDAATSGRTAAEGKLGDETVGAVTRSD